MGHELGGAHLTRIYISTLYFKNTNLLLQILFSPYLYALSYAKGSFRMFLTFVTGGHGGDGYVILGWLIFISIFMSCKDDMDFIWTWTKIWTLLDRIPMIYSISNIFDFNIRPPYLSKLPFLGRKRPLWCWHKVGYNYCKMVTELISGNSSDNLEWSVVWKIWAKKKNFETQSNKF